MSEVQVAESSRGTGRSQGLSADKACADAEHEGDTQTKEASSNAPASDDAGSDEHDVAQCVICYNNPRGHRLQPCGHDHFCGQCAQHFRTCPLCRQPVVRLMTSEDAGTAQQPLEMSPGQEPVLSTIEAHIVAWIGGAAWAFIFLGGWIEWSHKVPTNCNHMCDNNCTHHCDECKDGFIQAGYGCYEHVDKLPPVQTGAALHGTTYFVLIVLIQVAGASTEIALIQRLRRRGLMPRKELIVLIVALMIELTRMFMVDVFVLQDYFSGRKYQVFRVPVLSIHSTAAAGSAWVAADGQLYQTSVAPYSEDTKYYIASRREAFSSEPTDCSIFTTSDALLDYDETSGTWGSGGHPRFTRIGWVIGGEFALYYFFATFINEVADNMFVVPTTTSAGWRCKIFSIALELFQLGALCPAAIFTHGECLHYTDPLGVSMHLIRGIIVAFGYCIWSFILSMIPLAIIGLVIMGILFLFSSFALHALVWVAARCCGQERAERVEQWGLAVEDQIVKLRDMYRQGLFGLPMWFMMLSFIPLLLSGIFLGTLVVMGQASKKGAMNVLTAFVLLSDVLFKISATVVTEVAEYALHVRVRRAIARQADQEMEAEVIGRTEVSANNDIQLRPEWQLQGYSI